MSNVKFKGYPLIKFLLNEVFNVLKMRVSTIKKRERTVLAIIDIDQLLLATEAIAEESVPFHLDTFDIDQLLDKTDYWNW